MISLEIKKKIFLRISGIKILICTDKKEVLVSSDNK
jgi:hypothetical protein